MFLLVDFSEKSRPGHSGSGVFDADGRVIGMVTSIQGGDFPTSCVDVRAIFRGWFDQKMSDNPMRISRHAGFAC